MFPDANANYRNRPDNAVHQVNYGQIQDIFYVELKEHGDPEADNTYLLARINPCEITRGEDAAEECVEYMRMASHSIIVNLLSVEAAVGRVRRHTTWCIIDRSHGAVRTLFTGDDNAPTESDNQLDFVSVLILLFTPFNTAEHPTSLVWQSDINVILLYTISPLASLAICSGHLIRVFKTKELFYTL